MNKLTKTTLALILLGGTLHAAAQKDPDVGNVTMNPKKTLMENIALSPIHQKLEDNLNTTTIAATLSGTGGPYTVFAPTDDAFNKPAEAALAKADNAALTRVLQYHVVQGKLTSKKLGKLTKKGKTATLKTLEGDNVTIRKSGNIYILTDAKGGTAVITTPDVKTRNGYFHVIDAVLLPS